MEVTRAVLDEAGRIAFPTGCIQNKARLLNRLGAVVDARRRPLCRSRRHLQLHKSGGELGQADDVMLTKGKREKSRKQDGKVKVSAPRSAEDTETLEEALRKKENGNSLGCKA
jgi:hypothetical protein